MSSNLVYLLGQIINNPDKSINLPRAGVDSNTIANGLRLVFGVAGGIALIIITLAGLKFVLANGDPASIAKAKNTIIYALLGLVVCITGFSIVNFVLQRV